jgi:hypothetical protein
MAFMIRHTTIRFESLHSSHSKIMVAPIGNKDGISEDLTRIKSIVEACAEILKHVWPRPVPALVPAPVLPSPRNESANFSVQPPP